MERATSTTQFQVIFVYFPANLFYDVYHWSNDSIPSISVPYDWKMDGTAVNIRRNWQLEWLGGDALLFYETSGMRHKEDGNFNDDWIFHSAGNQTFISFHFQLLCSPT